MVSMLKFSLKPKPTEHRRDKAIKRRDKDMETLRKSAAATIVSHSMFSKLSRLS